MTETPITLLLVEDNRLEAHRIQRMLREARELAFTVTHVERLQNAFEAITQDTFQVILLDLVLPDSNDLRTLRRMQANSGDTPIVVLTNLEDDRSAMTAVQTGAQDYLTKTTLTSATLVRSIRYAIERQDLHRTLQVSAQRWRRAVSLARDPILLFRASGVVTFANDALCTALRREPHEIVGHPYQDLLAPDEEAGVAEGMAELRDTKSTQFLTRLTRGSGAPVPMEFTVVDLEDGEFQAICRDVSRWLETQEALRTSEERFHRILEATTDAVITVNAEEHIVLFNHAAESMFGVLASAAMGRPLSQFIPEAMRTTHHEHLRHFATEPRMSREMQGRATFTVSRADGTPFPIEATISKIQVNDEWYFTAIVRDVSARETAARTARAMTDRFQALTANSFDLVSEMDFRGCLLFVSPNTASILGHEASALLGTNAADLVHPEDRPEYQRTLAQLEAGTGRLRVTLRMQHRYGEWRWMGGTGTVYRSEDGGRRVLMVNRDITERTMFLEELRESGTRYRLMLDGAPDAVWLLSAGLRFTYVNEAACRLFDHAREDLTEQPLVRFLAPNEGVKAEESLRTVRRDGISDLVTTVRRPAGSSLVVEVHTVDLGSGMYQCAARDITVWVDPVQARAASTARYDNALAKATDGIWILDADQRFTYANPAACRLLGRSVEELLGTPISHFVPAAERAQVDAAHATLLAAGSVTCNLTLLRPDASLQTVDVEARTLEDGTCQAFVREVAT